MKSSRIAILFILLLGVILFATNPSTEDFKEHYKSEYQKTSEDEGKLAGAVKKATSGVAASVVGSATERSNYFLCSTYEAEILGEKMFFLGIANQFVRLN